MLKGVVAWPSQFVQRYRDCGYWMGKILIDSFTLSAAAHAEREAIVDGERRLTCQELARLVTGEPDWGRGMRGGGLTSKRQ